MLLNNLHIPGYDGLMDIRINQDKIKSISAHETVQNSHFTSLHFTRAIAFPGLINSHDHLDFNCYPALANKTYSNYREWGHDIQVTFKETISRVLKIPQALRTRWGVYKNLLTGVTSVVNHGEQLLIDGPLINVVQCGRSLHSPGFEKNWRWKINNLMNRTSPFVMHLGEGTDAVAAKEIQQVIYWNLFKQNIIAVHGVAMTKEQAKYFSSLVWCPASNEFLLRKTASVGLLKKKTKIIFGTDSTLTASWNIWDHLRMAREKNMLTDKELFKSVTNSAAETWCLKNTGKIEQGYIADIVIARIKNDSNGFDDFYNLNPEDILLVVHKGLIRLFDESLLLQLVNTSYDHGMFSKISIEGVVKYVEGDLPGLIEEIKSYYTDVQFPVKI